MYLNALSKITIGNIVLQSTNLVEIEENVRDLDGKCTIVLPRNLVAKDGKGVTDYIKRKDKVKVELGYNGYLHTEFEGYVDVIGGETPLRIECDNMWFPHKQNNLLKSFKDASLKEVLEFAFPGYTIDCPDTQLGKFLIQNTSSYGVLKGLKDTVGFYAKLDEEKKKITGFYPFSVTEYTTHTYVFGTHNKDKINELKIQGLSCNVKKNNLKFIRKDALKIALTAKALQRDGKTLKVVVGSTESDAEKRTRNYGYEIKTEAELKAVAEKDLKKWSYDGYQGNLIGFGVPRTHAGDTIKIVDPDNEEREGKYLIDKVKITYSADNAQYERINTLSYKI